jgi:hypothetical protein
MVLKVRLDPKTLNLPDFRLGSALGKGKLELYQTVINSTIHYSGGRYRD